MATGLLWAETWPELHRLWCYGLHGPIILELLAYKGYSYWSLEQSLALETGAWAIKLLQPGFWSLLSYS
jgi:hypothetical protein